MSVWFAIPSKRPKREAQPIIDLWRERGYSVAIFRDEGDEPLDCDLQMTGPYLGWPASVNTLAAEIMARDPEAEWIVTGGDDTEPDQRPGPEIARECTEHFGGTFGIMQPTGDGHGIDTICGSPWLGREWCRRGYGGQGPLWAEYRHMFADNDLQYVALKLGILWQRPDLTHKHRHWSFERRAMPAWMAEANSPHHWQKYGTVWRRRHAEGYPGHEPIP